MRLNIHEMKQAAQLVLDWHCYIDQVLFAIRFIRSLCYILKSDKHASLHVPVHVGMPFVQTPSWQVLSLLPRM